MVRKGKKLIMLAVDSDAIDRQVLRRGIHLVQSFEAIPTRALRRDPGKSFHRQLLRSASRA